MRFFKTMLFTGVLTAFLIASGFNMAYAKFDSCEQWGIGCPEEEPDNGSVNVENDIDITAKGGNAEINLGNGFGNKVMSPEANAYAGAAAVGFFDVDNEIDMDQKQSQKQKQAQQQGQVAISGAIQGQTAHNEGVKTKITVEGDTITYKEQPNHINPVAGPDTDTQTVKSKAHGILTKGSLMDRIDGFPLAALKLASKDAGDVEIMTAVVFEPKESVNFVRVGDSGEFAGYFYGTCDDDECSAAGMEAKAMLKAAEMGFTHIKKIDQDDMEKLFASEWSLKLGGGASVAANGGNTMIAPGGGVGGGAAESNTILLPAMAFEVYYDVLYINLK